MKQIFALAFAAGAQPGRRFLIASGAGRARQPV